MKRASRSPSPEAVTALYMRVTRDTGDTENQRVGLVDYATRKGWRYEVYEEPRNVSGSKSEEDRPALARLMADARAGRIERVLVRHLDRLGRGRVLEELVLGELRELGVRVEATLSGPVDNASAGGKFIARVESARGAYESDLTAERVREMHRRRRREGHYIGPTPYGYTGQARLFAELTALYGDEQRAQIEAQQRVPLKSTLVIDPDEAPVVREMFSMVVDQRLGARAIARKLNERGTLRRGRRWYAQTVRRILRDPKVAGWVHYDEDAYDAKRAPTSRIHETVLYPGRHEAIVDKDTWQRAQAQFERGRAKRDDSREEERWLYPLSGYARCVHGHTLKGTSGYYVCSPRKRHGDVTEGCTADPVSSTHLDEAITKELRSLLTSPTRVARVLNAANERLAREQPARNREMQQLDRDLADALQKRARLMSFLEIAEGDDQARILLGQVSKLDAAASTLRERRDTLAELARAAERPKQITEAEVSRFLEGLFASCRDDGTSLEALVALLADHHGLEITVLNRYEARIRISLQPVPVAGRQRGQLQVVETARIGMIEYTVPTGVERPVEEWVAAHQGRHLCECGCDYTITVLPIHHALSKQERSMRSDGPPEEVRGIPRYIQGHSPSPMELIQEELNAKGLLTKQQAAKILKKGETTLIRWEARGKVHPEWREFGNRPPMRVYLRAEIEALRDALKKK
jgi:site-specific DNA recombinase